MGNYEENGFLMQNGDKNQKKSMDMNNKIYCYQIRIY